MGLSDGIAAGPGSVPARRDYAAEAHFKAGVAFCYRTPIPIFQGTTREWYADMLLMHNAGDDHGRAVTLYAEAADNYERLGLVLYASRLAEKRARLT